MAGRAKAVNYMRRAAMLVCERLALTAMPSVCTCLRAQRSPHMPRRFWHVPHPSMGDVACALTVWARTSAQASGAERLSAARLTRKGRAV